MGVEHVVEPLERGAGAQKVGPHRQDDGHPPRRRSRGVQEVGEERVAAFRERLLLLFVLRPVGEDLLELVDHDEEPGLGRGSIQSHAGEGVEHPFVAPHVVAELERLPGIGQRTGRDELRRHSGPQLLERIVAGADDGDWPALAAVDGSLLEPRDQTGQHHR